MNNFTEVRPTIDLGIERMIESCYEVYMMGLAQEHISNEELFHEYSSTFIKLPRLTGKTTSILGAYIVLKARYHVKLIVPRYKDKQFVESFMNRGRDYDVMSACDAFSTEKYRGNYTDIILVDEYKSIEERYGNDCWYDIFLKADKPMIFGIGT